MTQKTTTQNQASIENLVQGIVQFLRTCKAPRGVFAGDVETLLYEPYTRQTLRGIPALEAAAASVSDTYTVEVHEVAPTSDGFVMTYTQRTPDGHVFPQMCWIRVQDGVVRRGTWFCAGSLRHAH